VYSVELDGEAVLLDQEANRLHHLNATATLVWACLDGQSTLESIATDLGAGLGVDRGVVLEDTITVVRSLADEGLVALEPAWQWARDVLTRRSLDTWLVMAPGGGGPSTLAGSAAEVWDLLDQPRTLADLVGALAERYAVGEDELRTDLVAVLDDLGAKGLVDVVGT
jgi:hypothetical protein